ncbi:MAG: hypothetical protein U0798_16075 [Gemmataceae bacterium]
MTDRWGGENGPIKKEAMINALQSILLKLPRNTVVSIRVLIGNREYTDRDGTRLIFPNKEFPEKNFRDLVTESGGPLIDILKGRGEGKKNTMFPDGATPLLPLMKKTIDEDFPKGYEGVKTLVVLTDGADTTWFSQIFGNVEFKAKEVKKESGKRDKLIDDVHKDLKRNLSESGVSIQFLIFGADEDETTLAEEMFKPIENHDAPGQIYRPENISDLKQKLESSLRPKPRLLKNGNPIPNSPDERKYLPSSGIPVNHISQGPGGIKWWGYIAPDNLTLSYGIQQKVNFSKSDCLMLKMIRNGQNKIAFQREIYYKDVDKSIPRNRIDENDDWFLAVPEYGRRNESFTNFLLATATLDEKRTVSVDPSFPLSQINPRFAWWEFNRSVAGKIERFPGTVYVRNSPGLYAPAWRIIGDVGGNFTNELRDSTYSIRGWAQRDILPSIPNLSISFKPNEYASRTYESKVKDGITVRVSLEDIRFMKDPPVDAGRLPVDVTAEKKRCLVVRIEDEAGRILQAQIPSMRDLIREHRYYYEKDNGVANGVRPKVASYTGIFGPVNIDALNQQIEIEVVSISQAIADNDQIKSVKVDLGSPPDSSTQLLPPDPQKPPK